MQLFPTGIKTIILLHIKIKRTLTYQIKHTLTYKVKCAVTYEVKRTLKYQIKKIMSLIGSSYVVVGYDADVYPKIIIIKVTLC